MLKDLKYYKKQEKAFINRINLLKKEIDKLTNDKYKLKEQLNLPVVSKSVVCDYCNDTGWDSYPNHDTTQRPCPECQP